MADKYLQAYAYSILAKDAAGRYSNPRRALRSYEDIMAIADGGDALADKFLKIVEDKLASREDETKETKKDPKPEHDNSKLDAKEFYRFVKESKQVSNNILAKLDKLAPPPTP